MFLLIDIYKLTSSTNVQSSENVITVSNEDFSYWFSELNKNPEPYEGFTIQITGYIYRDSSSGYEENEFAIARLMITCCVSDLCPAGITCQYEKASELATKSWVTIVGVLQLGTYEYDGKQFSEPQIIVNKVRPAEPVNEYIYPI